ncbi:hypothetical protein F8154_05510 [Alkaliphilus pronyensis]|uniref:Nucleotidase n=1 Tax=Alkaliphilus pronyensis TaxID=1482732 RepID=A0A6I0F0F1_9FIRM|nr:hypothetical protein [Alkaliphilus pronyensis]KAB3535758.1 hypothetical protein F8154_05510 [Alkaliphilus pronyensis]
MNRLNLCIDIDGTVTGAYDWIPRINNYFNVSLKPKDIKYYEIHRVLGVDSKEYDMFYHQYGEIIHKEASIRTGARKVLQKLYKHNKIHFVTAREEKMRNVTDGWFEKNQIPYHTLSLLGSHNKVQRAKDLACDIFIEDRYENAIQLSNAGFEVLLINCYYNLGSLTKGITRVTNWSEIEDYINKRCNKQLDSYKLAT